MLYKFIFLNLSLIKLLQTALPELLSYFPAGTSVKTLLHFYQNIITGTYFFILSIYNDNANYAEKYSIHVKYISNSANIFIFIINILKFIISIITILLFSRELNNTQNKIFLFYLNIPFLKIFL